MAHERVDGGVPKLEAPEPRGGRPAPRTAQEAFERALDLNGITEPHLRARARAEKGFK